MTLCRAPDDETVLIYVHHGLRKIASSPVDPAGGLDRALLQRIGSYLRKQNRRRPRECDPATPVTAYDPTKPEVQPNLALDRDPILSPDPADNAPVSAQSPLSTETPGEIQKGRAVSIPCRKT